MFSMDDDKVQILLTLQHIMRRIVYVYSVFIRYPYCKLIYQVIPKVMSPRTVHTETSVSCLDSNFDEFFSTRAVPYILIQFEFELEKRWYYVLGWMAKSATLNFQGKIELQTIQTALIQERPASMKRKINLFHRGNV